MIASCGFLQNELRQLSREEGVTLAKSVETLGVDLRAKVEKVGAKEKSKEEEVQGEVLTYKEEQSIPKELHESWCPRSCCCERYDASKGLGDSMRGDVSHGEETKKETDGSGCGQKRYDLPVFVHGSIRP